MADVYRPHACTEREALERLASEADLGQDRLSRIRLEFDSSVHRRITLWVPDLVGQSRPPESAMGVDEGLARLLVNVTTATADPRRAAEPSHERLFIMTTASRRVRRRRPRDASTARALRHTGARRQAAIRRGRPWRQCLAAPRARRSRASLGLLRPGGAGTLRRLATTGRLRVGRMPSVPVRRRVAAGRSVVAAVASPVERRGRVSARARPAGTA